MPLTFSEIAASGVLAPAEAAGLVLGAMAVCEDAARRGESLALPDAEHILLAPDGRVSFAVRAPDELTSSPVRPIVRLLRELLGLDGEAVPARGNVPGALMLLMARAAGQIDLPPPSYAAAKATLGRFGSADAPVLSSLYSRAARTRMVAVAESHLEFAGAGRRRGTQAVVGERSRAGWRYAAAAAAAAAVLFFVRGGTPDPWRDTAAQKAGDAVSVRIVDVHVPAAAPAPLKSLPGVDAEGAAVRTHPLLSPADLGTDVFSPSFAQADRVLLFHSGRDRAALMRATFDQTGTPAVATVLRDGAANYHATSSPDGEWLAYDSDRDGTRAVYVARADGSDARKVSGAGYAAVPRWSPDGRRLTFVKADAARPRVWNVWLADLAAGTLTRVSGHRVGQAWGASWFPDGQRIAYSVEDKLVIVNVGDGSTRVLPGPRRGRLVRTPAVSPDGAQIVFQVYRDGVWLLDVATGAMRRVIGDAAAEEFAWSSDGRRVVFHTRRNGAWSVWQLQLGRAAG